MKCGKWILGGSMDRDRCSTLTLSLSIKRNKVVAQSLLQRPMWLMQIAGLWKIHDDVIWQAAQINSKFWWFGQRNNVLVIIGRGPRPHLFLKQNNWNGMVPAGVGPTEIILPSQTLCKIHPLNERRVTG